MALYKGFNLWVCEQDGTDIAYLGRCVFPMFQTVTDPVANISFNLTTDTYAKFSPYIDEPANAGICVSDYYVAERINRLLTIAPLTLIRKSVAYSGYYLKLGGNTSGYYAISHGAISSQGYVSQWDLYDNNDNLIGSQISGANNGFPMNNSASIRFNSTASIEDGLITGRTATTYNIPIPAQNVNTLRCTCQTGLRLAADFIPWYNALAQTAVDPPADDPYAEGGISGPGGGDGTFDFSSTPVAHPGAPTIGAYDTGFVSLYNPSAAQLRSLAAYLWSGAFDVDNFRKIVADPMDAILGLSIIPVTPPSAGATLMVGNISTGLSMPKVTQQYVVVSCGSVSILPKWGAYLDFSPYSKLQLYLPYIGIVDINPDDCMNGTIDVQYIVDVLSGTCSVTVLCNDHVLYALGGECSCPCPVTAGQYKNGAFGILGALGGISGAVGGSMSGNVGGVTGGLEDAANSIISMVKPDIQRSGNIGGSSGLMGIQFPYLILTIPRMCTPGQQNEYIGYPSYMTVTLGDLSGYTEVDSIHLSGIAATDAEIDEIESLLKEGVIF